MWNPSAGAAADAVGALRSLSLHVVALVLFASGAQKVRDLPAFRRGLLFIPYVRESWSYPIGYTLPMAEIALALGLLCGSRLAACAAIGLFVAFAAVAALAVSRRLAVPCNCFGAGGARVLSPDTIVLNGVLVALLLVVLPSPSPGFEWIGLITAGGLVLAVMALAALRDALAVARRSLQVKTS